MMNVISGVTIAPATPDMQEAVPLPNLTCLKEKSSDKAANALYLGQLRFRSRQTKLFDVTKSSRMAATGYKGRLNSVDSFSSFSLF